MIRKIEIKNGRPEVEVCSESKHKSEKNQRIIDVKKEVLILRRVREVPGSIPSQYQRCYLNCTSSSLVYHSTLKREILALSQELR